MGLFLTLSFCLLAQPTGSLLYSRPTIFVDGMVSFFWRINPLTGAMEAVLVLVAFLDTVRRWLLTLTLSEGRASQGLFNRLHITARALHLLRGRWMANPRVIESSPTSNPPNQRSSPVRGRFFPPRTSILSSENDSESLPPPYLDESSPASSLDIVDRTRVAVAGSPPMPSSTQPPTASDLERAMPPGLGRQGRGVRRKRKSVLSRSEFIANIVSTTAMTTVIAKLVSIRVPLHFHVAAWLMTSSWIAVQVVLLLAYDGARVEVASGFEEDIAARALQLRAFIHHDATWITLFVLLIPLFGHLISLFHFRNLAYMIGWRIGFVAAVIYLILRMAYHHLSTSSNCCCLRRRKELQPACQQACRNLREGKTWRICGFITLAFAASSALQLISIPQCLEYPFLGWWWCAPSFTTFYCMEWDVLFFPWCISRYQDALNRKVGGGVTWMLVLFGITLSGLAFAEALNSYDVSESYKPEWLDWFGKF